MNKKSQRFIAFLFSTVFLVATFSACSKTSTSSSSQNSTDTNTVDKPITFTYFMATPGKVPPETNRILKKITEKTGVTIKFEYLVGEAKQKIGVMAASGDLPDLIDAGDGAPQMIDSGSYLPLENEIDKYSNIKAYLGSDWKKMKNAKDGHIYFIPQFGIIKNKVGATTHNGEAFWIQKSVLKEFNYPAIPKTLDEYFGLIQKYKDKYPTIQGKPTVGFEILSYDWRSFCLINPPPFLAGHPNDGTGLVDPKNNVVTNFADKDCSKDYYKKLNEAYNKGLIDPETFVQNYDQYIAKLSTGRVLGMIDQAWQFGDATNSLIKQDMIERTYVPCPVTLDGGPDRYADRPVLNTNAGLSITTKCKDPARALKFINDLLSVDNQKLLRWGEKDVDYKLDDKGVASRTEEQRKQQADPDWVLANTGAPFVWFPHNEGFFDDGNAIDMNQQPGEYLATLKQVDKEILAAYKFKTFAEFISPAPPNPVYYPMWTQNFPANAPESVAKAKIEELQKKYDTKMIIGKPADYDKTWNEYLGELKKVDMKAYEDSMNKELQRRLKEWQ